MYYYIILEDEFEENPGEFSTTPKKIESYSAERAIEIFCENNESGLLMDYGSDYEFNLKYRRGKFEEWLDCKVEIETVAHFVPRLV